MNDQENIKLVSVQPEAGKEGDVAKAEGIQSTAATNKDEVKQPAPASNQ